MNDSLYSGLFLLNKTPGLTSFQALGRVKKLFSTSKVGHTGTLDKFASGLLPVLVGRAVKLAPWFSGCDKEYEALIRFGEETDTLDPEGAIIASAPLPGREAVEAALPRFRGEIAQKPPEYSALHLDGKRAHELARAGVAVEMPSRNITIYQLELLSWEPPFAQIRVHCSKGTYIRSLARDIALAAGSRAHLAGLKRTRVADFRLEEAVSPGEFAGGGDFAGGDRFAGSGNSTDDSDSAGSGNCADTGGSADSGNSADGDRVAGSSSSTDNSDSAHVGAAADAFRAALLPLSAGLFARLGISSLETGPAGKARLVRGQAIGPLAASGELWPEGGGGDFPPRDYAVFGPDSEFIAIIQKKETHWEYGYVYAGAEMSAGERERERRAHS